MVGTMLAPRAYRRTEGSLRRASSVSGRNLTALQTGYWLHVISGFFEPLLYLLSIGVGVGALIGHVTLPDGETVSYATFVAPAMLASSAMTGALAESTFNFFEKMKVSKIYDGTLATPVRPMEIAIGELLWAMARGGIYSGAFLVIMVLMHLTTPGLAVVAFFAAVLTGFAFGSVGMGMSTFVRSWQDFDLINTVQVALFLFSATFVPLSSFHSPVVRFLIQLSPLYQAVTLIRGITLDRFTPTMLVNVGYLIALTAVGLLIASRRMGRKLLR
jgi:lipooligosaccharide transport system permease protein